MQNKVLYNKAQKGFDLYKEWLLNQPPTEILKHTYEYNINLNILMYIENNPIEQLLQSESPLEDIYNKLDINIEEDIKQAIHMLI